MVLSVLDNNATGERLLTSSQNKMPRRIVGPRRAPDEPRVNWIKRSTHAAVRAAEAAGVRFWFDAHFAAKWSWAGHVARLDPQRLASRSTFWRFLLVENRDCDIWPQLELAAMWPTAMVSLER